jgi:hypothetical protein
LWSALSNKTAAKVTRDTPVVVMEPSQEPPPRQPPVQKKTEPPKPDPEKRAVDDARRLEKFAEQLRTFRSTLGKASVELSNIQRQFPGAPPPMGDARDPEWVDWALQYRSFKALQSRATAAVASCTRALPSVPTRPVQADEAAWKALQEDFRKMRKMLDMCRTELGNEQHWMFHGAGQALQTLEQCDEFVAGLLK